MSANIGVKEFGRYLKACRRSKGVSLEVISHKTKITTDILRQIENEDLDRLPAPVFVKGFIKAFANAVGADPDVAVQRFENYLACRNQACEVPSTDARGSASGYRMALALALFILQIGATLYLAQWMQIPTSQPQLLPGKSSEPIALATDEVVDEVTPEPKQVAVSEAATVSAPESMPVVESVKVQPPPQGIPSVESASVASVVDQESPDRQQIRQPKRDTPSPLSPSSAPNLKLHMTAVEATWLKVASDDKTPKEYLLQTDQKVTVVAKNGFDLVIGNAGGIRLTLNEQPVTVIGKRGQVVDIHLP